MQQEKIEVRYTETNFASAGGGNEGSPSETFYHKYILYTDSNGNQFAARGGTTLRTGDLPSVDAPLGTINIDIGAFDSNFPDFLDPSVGEHPGETIVTGTDLSSFFQTITDTMNAIQDAKINYWPHRNSNSAVDTALMSAGLSAPQLDGNGDFLSPGSGNILPIGAQPDPDNNLLNNGTNFNKGAVDESTANDTADFENGTARDGGNHSSEMPDEILNDDGANNAAASGTVTDDYRPGAVELGSSDTFLGSVGSAIGDLVQGVGNFVGDVVGGVVDFVGDVVSGIGSAVTGLFSGIAKVLNIDPVVLDMDGDGVELISFDDSYTTFDVDNDGIVESTGWVHPDDALLVHDVNGDGHINDITETISEYYLAAPGQGALYSDGLEALATLDTNADGVFDNADAAFTVLRVWQDANADAVTDIGELKTLVELGITSIDLNREIVSREEIEGNPILSRSTMTINGASHDVAAVDFATNPLGYEWNDVAQGLQIVTEDGQTSIIQIEDILGMAVDLSLLNGDADITNDAQGVVGNVGDDILLGDSGDNWLIGAQGADIIQAGEGNDLIVIDADDSLANIDAGEDADGMDLDIVQIVDTRGVVLNLNDINAEVALGGTGDDVIFGGANTNVFVRGGLGDDVIIGGSADDALSGEDGNDTLDGGRGDDVIRGHRGADLLIGDLGEDYLAGGLDDDAIYGDEGEDLLRGDQGNDSLFGGADYDVAEFSGKLDEYDVERLANGSVRVADRVEGRDGVDILTDIEALNFQNIKEVQLDLQNPFTANDVVNVSGTGPYVILASDILANDIDYQGDSLSLTGVSDALGGSVILNAQGDVVFTPNASYDGVFSFRYTIMDSDNNPGALAVLKATGESSEVKGSVNLAFDDHPEDSLFYDQWYLSEANILPVWTDYSGQGVTVGVFEIGIADLDHPDLVDNLSQETLDAGDPDSVDGHATLVSGVIAAARNTQGSVGVAYDATLSAYALGDPNPDFSTLLNFQNFDVANNSWGFTEAFAATLGDDNAFEQAAAFGRDGLGTVIVFAAGNERQDGGNANADSLYNNKYTISVAAINKNADLSSLEIQQDPFSNPGANILISAPGSNITSTSVLLENSNGSTFGDTFDTAEGTSFATPIVSGVAALLLEANPRLGYRDVMEILAYSAKIVDDENTDWQTNGAQDWNGGGLHFSHDYGFGNVDALAASRLAETWVKTQTYDTEINFFVDGTLNNAAIPDDGSNLSDVITIGLGNPALTVEHATIKVDFTHQRVGDLEIELLSPNGTVGKLLTRLGVDPDSTTDLGHGPESLEFSFGNVSAWGEPAYGDWTLLVRDLVTGETGTIHNWSLELSGNLAELDDTYVYTDAFADQTDIGRFTLHDTNGGDDAINAAAVKSGSLIDLNATSNSSIAGQTLTIAAGSTIERALSGDGDDTLIGNAANNLLFGGRGADNISGGQGNDWLIAASGSDTATGGTGLDRFVIRHGDVGQLTVTDFDLTSDLILLSGFETVADISDLILGLNAGNTEILLPDGQLVILEGIAPASLTNSNFSFAQAINLASVELNVFEQRLTEGDDYFYHPQDSVGNPVQDTTPQRVFALGGDDQIFGNLGDDEIFGGDGNDTLNGYTSSGFFSGGNDTLYGEAGDDTLYGSGSDDLLFGGIGNDILLGNKGDDVLHGGEGRDILIGDDPNSTSLAGVGNDEIHLEHGLNEVWGDHFNIDPLLWDGSLGDDTFVVHKWDNFVSGGVLGIGIVKDLIRDFSPDHDVIDIRAVQGATRFEELGFTSLNLNGTAFLRVTLNDTDFQTITLDGGLTQADLSAANFVFYENVAPDAKSDVFDMAEDTVLHFTAQDLLINDTDVEDGVPEFTKIVTGPSKGTLLADGTGAFTYTPDLHAFGSDSFVYEVIDTHGVSATSLVTINVSSVNDAPVAQDDYVETVRDMPVVLDVLANDTDPDNDVLVIETVGPALHGVAVLNADDTISYTPNLGFLGEDSITYVVSDGLSQSETALVTISIGGGDGDDVLYGTADEDMLFGGSGADQLYGADGDDSLIGGAGDDALFGEDGDDVLIGGAGDDQLDGGAGFDTADYSNLDSRVVVFLNKAPADVGSGQGIDTFVSVENVVGTDFDDRLVGDGADNTLDGGNGDDVLIGNGGNDTLFGRDGDDTLNGTGGNDVLNGGFGDDVLLGLGGADALDGDAGNDHIEGGLGVDVIDGGNDDDDIFGFFGADAIKGGNGDDDIRADGSADTIEGGAGRDRIVGGNGKDTVWGGAGNDTLFGGGGHGNGDGLRDVFVFKSAANGGGGFDIIRDFENNIDKIDMSESGYSDAADVIADASQVGADVEINFDFAGLLRINDFTLADLNAGDFFF
ncbi:MAG: tandem-95 repeat protein [Aliishimia sp.]